jgi:hypothetical protein
MPWLVSASALAMNLARELSSERACSRVTPGARRASTRNIRALRSSSIHVPVAVSCPYIVAGTHRSNERPAMDPPNSFGATPITV